jgi:hypothetical protein
MEGRPFRLRGVPAGSPLLPVGLYPVRDAVLHADGV